MGKCQRRNKESPEDDNLESQDKKRPLERTPPKSKKQITEGSATGPSLKPKKIITIRKSKEKVKEKSKQPVIEDHMQEQKAQETESYKA